MIRAEDHIVLSISLLGVTWFY